MELETISQDMGRLPGARQIAGVHLVEGDSTRVEVCAQGPSLLYPKLRQWVV